MVLTVCVVTELAYALSLSFLLLTFAQFSQEMLTTLVPIKSSVILQPCYGPSLCSRWRQRGDEQKCHLRKVLRLVISLLPVP
jgi:hypothetical protein